MKKVIFSLLGVFLILVLVGCNINSDVSLEELNSINDKIIDYFQKNGAMSYNNYSYNYVDEENKMVVVGLADNSEKEREWFIRNVVNSKYLRFEQGTGINYEDIDVSNIIDLIVNNGPVTSSNPYDYIKNSQREYELLLNNPEETFEYAIKDLIVTNATSGLRSYIEALLCRKINNSFEYDFETANDYLEHYKEYLKRNIDFNSYDKYAISLLN